jgi:hypothetical protein
MRTPSLVAVFLAMALSWSCSDGPSRPLVHEQRLASGKAVKVVSCVFAWGVEHDERHPNQDGFALEYLSDVPHERTQDLEREVLEVFELIRPLSEQWRLSSASVTALRTPERTGTYDAFGFTRSADGRWSHTQQTITRNAD